MESLKLWCSTASARLEGRRTGEVAIYRLMCYNIRYEYLLYQ